MEEPLKKIKIKAILVFEFQSSSRDGQRRGWKDLLSNGLVRFCYHGYHVEGSRYNQRQNLPYCWISIGMIKQQQADSVLFGVNTLPPFKNIYMIRLLVYFCLIDLIR